jgi:hypothetical protein
MTGSKSPTRINRGKNPAPLSSQQRKNNNIAADTKYNTNTNPEQIKNFDRAYKTLINNKTFNDDVGLLTEQERRDLDDYRKISH